jgi:hypothetical protein
MVRLGWGRPSIRCDAVRTAHIHPQYTHRKLGVQLGIMVLLRLTLALRRARDFVPIDINVTAPTAERRQVRERTQALARVGTSLEVMLPRSEEREADRTVRTRVLVVVT